MLLKVLNIMKHLSIPGIRIENHGFANPVYDKKKTVDNGSLISAIRIDIPLNYTNCF